MANHFGRHGQARESRFGGFRPAQTGSEIGAVETVAGPGGIDDTRGQLALHPDAAICPAPAVGIELAIKPHCPAIPLGITLYGLFDGI